MSNARPRLRSMFQSPRRCTARTRHTCYFRLLGHSERYLLPSALEFPLEEEYSEMSVYL